MIFFERANKWHFLSCNREKGLIIITNVNFVLKKELGNYQRKLITCYCLKNKSYTGARKYSPFSINLRQIASWKQAACDRN
jgi:hypothetical protein